MSTLQLFFALEAIVANSVIVKLTVGQKKEYEDLYKAIIHGPAYWCGAIFILAALLGLYTAVKKTKFWVKINIFLYPFH